MIHKAEDNANKVLLDATGTMIPNVREFNDETNEVTILLGSAGGTMIRSGSSYEEGFELVEVKVVIKGARIGTREDIVSY